VDAGAALAELEALRKRAPRDPQVAGFAARLLRHAGRPAEACLTASEAIQMAVLADRPTIALDLLRDFRDVAERISLDPATAQTVSEAALRDGDDGLAKLALEQGRFG
ncbi:MAG: hypothetical protein AAGF12_37655, partial [Myxococcota bacterium]